MSDKVKDKVSVLFVGYKLKVFHLTTEKWVLLILKYYIHLSRNVVIVSWTPITKIVSVVELTRELTDSVSQ